MTKKTVIFYSKIHEFSSVSIAKVSSSQQYRFFCLKPAQKYILFINSVFLAKRDESLKLRKVESMITIGLSESHSRDLDKLSTEFRPIAKNPASHSFVSPFKFTTDILVLQFVRCNGLLQGLIRLFGYVKVA